MNDTKRANKFIFFLLLYQVFISLIINKISSQNFYLVYNQLISLFIPIVFYFVLSKKKISDVLQIKKISKKNLCLIFLLAITIQPVMSFFSFLTSIFFENHTQDLIPILFSKPMWIIFLSSAILPALFEEIIFRGIFFSEYKNIEPKKSFFINGLIFGAMHLNFQQFLYAMIMGIIFCTVVYFTQSIFSSILMHFVFNSTQILFAYISINNKFGTFWTQMFEFTDSIFVCLVLTLFFFVISILLLDCIIKNCKRTDNEIYNNEKILTLPLFLYLAFTFFIMCFN